MQQNFLFGHSLDTWPLWKQLSQRPLLLVATFRSFNDSRVKSPHRHIWCSPLQNAHSATVVFQGVLADVENVLPLGGFWGPLFSLTADFVMSWPNMLVVMRARFSTNAVRWSKVGVSSRSRMESAHSTHLARRLVGSHRAILRRVSLLLRSAS
jgi:hypothetical protein